MNIIKFADEVGALVFDFGSVSTRVGFAGEDCPKVNIILVKIFNISIIKGISQHLFLNITTKIHQFLLI